MLQLGEVFLQGSGIVIEVLGIQQVLDVHQNYLLVKALFWEGTGVGSHLPVTSDHGSEGSLALTLLIPREHSATLTSPALFPSFGKGQTLVLTSLSPLVVDQRDPWPFTLPSPGSTTLLSPPQPFFQPSHT